MGQALSMQLPSGSQVLETKVARGVNGLIVDYESSCALEFFRWSSEKDIKGGIHTLFCCFF